MPSRVRAGAFQGDTNNETRKEENTRLIPSSPKTMIQLQQSK